MHEPSTNPTIVTYEEPISEDVVDRKVTTTTRTTTTIITSNSNDPDKKETTVIVNETQDVNGDTTYDSETITAVPNRFSESDSDATSLQIQETLRTIVDEQERELEKQMEQAINDSQETGSIVKSKSRTIESSSGSDVALHEPGAELSEDETGMIFVYLRIYLTNFLLNEFVLFKMPQPFLFSLQNFL